MDDCKYSFKVKDSLIGAQMLFVAFGALVLVPLLTGLDPNVALFTSGVGTLIFQFITKRKVPIYLASSFAFIAPIQFGVKKWGIPATLCGLAAAGLLYLVFAALVKKYGQKMLHNILPPVVTSPVIMVIGLLLAPAAVNMAFGKSGDGSLVLVQQDKAVIIALVALTATVLVNLFGKGMMKCIPILAGITVGYVLAVVMKVVDFTPVMNAPWFSLPNFVFPKWSTSAVLYMLPVTLAPAIEHFGDILAIGSISGKDYIKDPGIHRTLTGDGVATTVAALLGGPPNTTYSEVSGAVAITKAFNPGIMTWAAITAIVLSCVGKLGAFLQTIPVPVMGGIMILLFGAISVVGLSGLVRSRVDVMNPRNLIIISFILVFGLGGMVINAGDISLKGIGLAGITGVFLNLILPRVKDDGKSCGCSEENCSHQGAEGTEE